MVILTLDLGRTRSDQSTLTASAALLTSGLLTHRAPAQSCRNVLGSLSARQQRIPTVRSQISLGVLICISIAPQSITAMLQLLGSAAFHPTNFPNSSTEYE